MYKIFDIDEYFWRSDDFATWKGVFEEYSMCTDRFIRVHTDQYDVTNAPYWNIERSNVGMLAAACWKNGWVALEEFATEKSKDNEENGSARCDLWVSSQSGKSNYAIEAKKGRSSLDSENMISNLEKLLIGDPDSKDRDCACEDAKKLGKHEGDKRMGIVFMHLYLPKSKSKNGKAVELAKKALQRVKEYAEKGERVRPDFVYLYLKSNGVESDDAIYPGVVIAGKTI